LLQLNISTDFKFSHSNVRVAGLRMQKNHAFCGLWIVTFKQSKHTQGSLHQTKVICTAVIAFSIEIFLFKS
jgi:hypothetical protein